MTGPGEIFILLLSAVHLVLSSPAGLLDPGSTARNLATNHLSARVDDDKYPWIALGDSYAAGPGAGTPFNELPDDCYRNIGAYPPQLNEDFPFPDPAMQFLACTGATVDSMVRSQIPVMDKDQMVVTLSIGGNDLGFGDVLKACIYKPAGPLSADCQKTIDATTDYIHQKLPDQLTKGYTAIFEKIVNKRTRVVIQQLYPGFFNQDTDWCDTQSMGKFPGYKPLLTKDLRKKLNRLADDAREVMKRTIDSYEPPPPINFPRLYYADEFDEITYPGHRFCEEGIEEFDNENIWFFTIDGNDSPKVTAPELLTQYDPKTCADDLKYKTDFAFGWYCDNVRYLATLNGNHGDFVTSLPEYIAKAFHPKTAAFTSIKDNHKDGIRRVGFPRESQTDQGALQCLLPHADGDENWYASREDMEKATAEFCQAMGSAGVSPGLFEGVYNGLHVSAEKNRLVGTCPPLDVGAKGFEDLCKARLRNPMDGCDRQKRSSELWKQGGSFDRDCITWHVGKHPFHRKFSPSLGNNTL